jgi:hypothetical protein
MFAYLDPDHKEKEGAFLPTLIFDKLTQSSIILGRSNIENIQMASCINSLNNLSREHALILIGGGTVLIKPTSSLHKGIIKVNDKIIPYGEETKLNVGDYISLLGHIGEWNYTFKDGLPVEVLAKVINGKEIIHFDI